MIPAASLSANTRGILFMIAACSGFILNDTCVKLASADIPVPQIIVLRSLIALPLVLLFAWHRGLLSNLLVVKDRLLWLRTFGEIGGTATYLSALARLEIANTTAIAQTTPLAVTAGAALLMGETVGIRRWSAIVIGFFAVLLIVRPGMEGFNAWSLVVLLSVAFVALRDLASRAMPLSIHPMTVTVLSLIVLAPIGLAMSVVEPWRATAPAALLYCLGAAVALSIAYVLVVEAMRSGEVSVVAPFRYVFLIWAILIQITIFGIWPDWLTVLGSAILVATGIFTLYRERLVRGAEAQLTSPSATLPPAT